MARTMEDLRQMQALPLSLKVSLTKSRIRQWVNEYGEDGVYVSFSGGKDSTVLLHLVRSLYPNVPAIFVNTGLEFPEIVQFVKTFDNVEIIRPKMNFKKVIEKYGYPVISKEVSESVQAAKKYLDTIRQTDRQTDSITGAYAIADMLGIERRGKDKTAYQALKKGNFPNNEKYKYGLPFKYLELLGKAPHKEKGKLTGEYSQRYDKKRWAFLLKSPFAISNRCCGVMKKAPAHEYQKKTGRNPITAQMASESRLRTQKWLENGCNGFNLKCPISNPMSFWNEQDVLQYIKQNDIKIASVYGDIVADEAKSENVEGQLRMNLDGTIEETACVLKTTGCKRTGCMFCGFGCHLEKPGEGRFERMKLTHPKLYEWIMKPWEDGGLNYKAVIDWLNENGGLNIKY